MNNIEQDSAKKANAAILETIQTLGEVSIKNASQPVDAINLALSVNPSLAMKADVFNSLHKITPTTHFQMFPVGQQPVPYGSMQPLTTDIVDYDSFFSKKIFNAFTLPPDMFASGMTRRNVIDMSVQLMNTTIRNWCEKLCTILQPLYDSVYGEVDQLVGEYYLAQDGHDNDEEPGKVSTSTKLYFISALARQEIEDLWYKKIIDDPTFIKMYSGALQCPESLIHPPLGLLPSDNEEKNDGHPAKKRKHGDEDDSMEKRIYEKESEPVSK